MISVKEACEARTGLAAVQSIRFNGSYHLLHAFSESHHVVFNNPSACIEYRGGNKSYESNRPWGRVSDVAIGKNSQGLR